MWVSAWGVLWLHLQQRVCSEVVATSRRRSIERLLMDLPAPLRAGAFAAAHPEDHTVALFTKHCSNGATRTPMADMLPHLPVQHVRRTHWPDYVECANLATRTLHGLPALSSLEISVRLSGPSLDHMRDVLPQLEPLQRLQVDGRQSDAVHSLQVWPALTAALTRCSALRSLELTLWSCQADTSSKALCCALQQHAHTLPALTQLALCGIGEAWQAAAACAALSDSLQPLALTDSISSSFEAEMAALAELIALADLQLEFARRFRARFAV